MINHPNRGRLRITIPAPDDKGTIKIDFGVRDRLGRDMGYIIHKAPTRNASGHGAAGLHFQASVSRNGFHHQSVTYYGPFATEADRDRKIEDVVGSAFKRALAPAARLKS